ncbi:hypothetical protein MTO96_026505 [Rhipicephalus appendiculatus]
MYYSLEQCESSDEVHEEHKGRLLPAAYPVNLPLRHLVEFAHVFGCSADSADTVRGVSWAGAPPVPSSCPTRGMWTGIAARRSTDVFRNCVARTSSSYFSATPAMWYRRLNLKTFETKLCRYTFALLFRRSERPTGLLNDSV